MNTTKAIIDFTDYTAPELGPVAVNIHTKMVLNAATFATPPITMTAFDTLITTYTDAQAAKASRAKADVLAANVTHDELEEALADLGAYVNTVAMGDPVIVEKSRFPSYDTAHTPSSDPPAAPTNLRLRNGSLSGSITARYKPDRKPSVNEVQINTGDPNNEPGWHAAGIFRSGKATITGLTPGTSVWVRVRTVGLNGVMGAWSDPAEIMVV